MNIAIIPARGGSKRIPRKNIKPFHGKPMIAYSIEAAKDADCFDRIVVSTDDQEIADIAMQYGAEVPFIRPENISDDYATTLDVIKHAIDELQMDSADLLCCIYATAPFVQPSDIVKGLHLIESRELDFAFSATEFSYPIQRALKLSNDGYISMYSPEYMNTRSQDLQNSYHDAGQLYWYNFSKKCIKRTIGFEISQTEGIDINTIQNFNLAKLLYKI